MRCVGYRQAWRFIDGNCTFDEFRLAGIAATRQLAKRQMTWLRSMTEAVVIEPASATTLNELAAMLDLKGRRLNQGHIDPFVA